jgi:hypothetical protein
MREALHMLRERGASGCVVLGEPALDRLFISAGVSACREPRVHLGSLAVCDFDLAHRFPYLFLIDHRERGYQRWLTAR